jgi:mannosyltransferase
LRDKALLSGYAKRVTRTRSLTLTAVAALLAIGLALRSWHLASEPLWLDEAYSAYAADHDLRFLWRVVPLYESHPPFYYLLLHFWVRLFGDGLLALRLPGLIFGVATLPVLAGAADEAGRLLGWDADRRRIASLIAFALASLSMALVEMAREVRPYPLIILIYAIESFLVLRMARRVSIGHQIGGPILASYLLLLESLLWLHNLNAVFGAALTVALGILVMRSDLVGRDRVRLLIGHALVALAYLPCLAIVHSQAATWIKSTWLHFSIDGLFVDRVFTLYGAPDWPMLAALLLAATAGYVLYRSMPRLLAALLVLSFLPLLLVILLSLTIAPVFITRTMTPLAAPWIVLLAIGAAGARARIVGLGATMVLSASLLAANVQLRRAGPMQDWYGTVDWLSGHFRPGDMVFAYPNEGKLPLVFALRDRGLSYPVRAIPIDVPALETRHGYHPTGTRGVSSLPTRELQAIAAEPATTAVPTIWLLRLGRETYDPGDAFLHALRRDRGVVGHWRDGPIDIVGLRSLPAPGRSPR